MWPKGLQGHSSSIALRNITDYKSYKPTHECNQYDYNARRGPVQDNFSSHSSAHNDIHFYRKSSHKDIQRSNYLPVISVLCHRFCVRHSSEALCTTNYITIVLFIVISLLSGCASASRDFHFPDIKQGEFAQNLNDFHISWPTRVDRFGSLISQDVHFQHSSIRSKRSINKNLTFSTNTANSDPDFSHPSIQSNYTVGNEALLHYRIPLHSHQEVIVRVTRASVILAPSAVLERKVSKFKNISDSLFSTLQHHHGCHYTGDIQGVATSKVALTACNGLRGFLQFDDVEYLIEPIKSHNKSKDGGQPHLVYRRSALPDKLNSMSSSQRQVPACGVKGEYDRINKHRERYERHMNSVYRKHSKEHSHSSHDRTKRSISIEKHVETLVVVDTEMVNYYQNEDIETYVLTVMNMVATLFHDASIGNAVNIVIVRIILMQDPDEDLQISHHADKTLKSFCKWQKNINFRDDDHPNHHDVAILLTRTNICSRNNEPCSTLGLAQVSGLCQPHRTCSINEDTGLSLAWTVAHEIGHNFGMKHDNQHSDCMTGSDVPHVMATHLIWDKTPSTWSNCSRLSITKFLDRNWGYCLDDPPGHHDFKYPELPAGTMYDADHQCRLLYGEGAERCTGIEALENICTTLWCRVNNKCSTKLQPAAIGTICGVDKWCFAGDCIDISERPQAIDGQWSQWAEWTDCTRTCGAGVSVSERHCNHPPPSNGGKYCTGERKRYRICNTENCPKDAPSFKAQQCSNFNEIPYKGSLYEWEPLSTPDTPCQLHCKPTNFYFSVLLKDVVTDGTPCVVGSRHICISGRCRHVGCDWIIDSNAVEDRCGVCFGDGSTCKTIKQQFNETKQQGYVEATVIPAGARNIRVEEVAEASNFLALKNEAGEYYLNGHWFIQWSGDYEVAGTVIHYKRIGNKEKFIAPGPLKEPLHIMLLMQSHNPGVEFEYTVPRENATSNKKPEFSWDYIGWSHCTVSCGSGTQRSAVVCKEKEAGLVDETNCDQATKPDDQLRECNVHLCPARWWMGPWQHCSVTCGDKGTHHRTVICIRSLGSDEQIALEDQACESLEKPVEMEPCHHKNPCPGLGVWEVEEWSNCTRPCNGGVQYRKVTCVREATCSDEKPDMKRPCNIQKCIDNQGKEILNVTDEGVGTDSVLLPDLILHSSPDSSRFTSVSNNNISQTDNIDVNSLNEVSNYVFNKDDAHMFSHTNSLNGNVYKHKHNLQNKSTSVIRSAKSAILSNTISRKPDWLSHENTSVANMPDEPKKNVENSQYIWQTLDWSKCSATCGPAMQFRKVVCTRPGYCDLSDKPESTRACKDVSPCFAWIHGDWSKCSKTCGIGIQERSVQCVNLTSKQLSEGCLANIKPDEIQECSDDECPADGNTAASVLCENNEMSSNVCRMLKKVGLCQKQHVQARCCRTCHTDVRPNSDVQDMSRR
ncbi:hypothetical protein BsWGS_00460 [Bradybaena similaris]